jgi:tetratricopeptide (TPR) repeat protein
MTQMTVKQALVRAVEHQRAGRLDAAEGIYRQILAASADNHDALHLLGVIASQKGDSLRGVELIRRAVELYPTSADMYFNLAMALADLDEHEEAIEAYRKAVALNPDLATVHERLGVSLMDIGRIDEAIAEFRRAIELDPGLGKSHNALAQLYRNQEKLEESLAAALRAVKVDYSARSYVNLGMTLTKLERHDDAIAAHKNALALNPDLAPAHNELGSALGAAGHFKDAIAAYRRAIALDPLKAGFHSNLGVALNDADQLEASIEAHQRAIALEPKLAKAHYNFSAVLVKALRFDEASAACRRAIELDSRCAPAHSNLADILKKTGKVDEAMELAKKAIELDPALGDGYAHLSSCLLELGRVQEAEDSLRRAIALRPRLCEAHFGLGTTLLLRGKFEEGWEEYEHRIERRNNPYLRMFKEPKWHGERLGYRALLVHAEQGLGDTIQFMRYLPLVLERAGGKVIFSCQTEVERLARSMALPVEIVPRGRALPAFGMQIPLLSLPRVLETRAGNIPANVPYIHADPVDVRVWQERLNKSPGTLDVGLVWAGNPSHSGDLNRSIQLAQLARLGSIAGVRLVSLQKGPAAAQAKSPPAGMRLLDMTEHLGDMSDTAALIASLDLVISVDTSVVHLAGAMGKAVWTLLPLTPDWRWQLEREDCPWYPSMRLFRQTGRGDWGTVIERVCGELETYAARGRGE